jgi:sulfatase modifying factor 1
METEGNRIKIFIIIVSMFLIPACSSAPESNKHQSAIISEQSQASVAPIKKFAGDFPTTNPPPKQYTNALGMDFVYIPAGTFMMGSPSYEYKRRSDEPQHEVTLSTGYYIQATEVTQGQWQKVMGENPSEFDNCGDKCPVEDVTWYETQDFIGKLNSHAGAKVYRLPTEAEWEYACRAGTDTPFAFGNCLSTNQANFSGMRPYADCPHLGGERSRTLPVASLQPNPWGIYDMHGNVWEWCQDWKGPYPPKPAVDPVGPSFGIVRIYRGGGQNDPANFCRSAIRGRYKPEKKSGSLGFRLAMSLLIGSTQQIVQGEKIIADLKEPSFSYISLRQYPKKITNDLEISRFIDSYNFFDHSKNPNGTFRGVFIDNNNGTIIDKKTNLMWQISGSDRQLYFKRAKSYIKQLNNENFAGYSDWRLPTVEELASLLTKTKGTNLYIDPRFNNKLSRCWTTDKCEPHYPHYDGAFIVNFSAGEVSKSFWRRGKPYYGAYRQNTDNYVKAVRTAQ